MNELIQFKKKKKIAMLKLTHKIQSRYTHWILFDKNVHFTYTYSHLVNHCNQDWNHKLVYFYIVIIYLIFFIKLP